MRCVSRSRLCTRAISTSPSSRGPEAETVAATGQCVYGSRTAQAKYLHDAIGSTRGWNPAGACPGCGNAGVRAAAQRADAYLPASGLPLQPGALSQRDGERLGKPCGDGEPHRYPRRHHARGRALGRAEELEGELESTSTFHSRPGVDAQRPKNLTTTWNRLRWAR